MEIFIYRKCFLKKNINNIFAQKKSAEKFSGPKKK